MATKNITTCDTHSITPNPGLVEGQKVGILGKVFTVTRASPYQVFFAKQGFSVPGASKANPVSLEIEVDGDLTGIPVAGVAKKATKVDETEAKMVRLISLLEGDAKAEMELKLEAHRAAKAEKEKTAKEEEIASLLADLA